MVFYKTKLFKLQKCQPHASKKASTQISLINHHHPNHVQTQLSYQVTYILHMASLGPLSF